VVATARPAARTTPGTAQRPAATPNPLAALAAGGPTSVGNLNPAPDTATRERLAFSWVADQPLAPGQVFEVAFWRPGESPDLGVGWTSATTDSTLSAKTYEQPPGDYFWGVWLGGFADGAYVRLRYLGGGNLLRVLPEPDPLPVSTPVENCPPTAPCRP
jgi:hypothetical protein